MARKITTAQVARAADAMWTEWVGAAQAGTYQQVMLLAPEAGTGVGLAVRMQEAVEADLFGEVAESLFRRRLLDLVEARVLEYRQEPRMYTERRDYALRHVPTGVPVDLRLVRHGEAYREAEWDAEKEDWQEG